MPGLGPGLVDGAADPVRRPWLASAEEYLRARRGEERLGLGAVPRVERASTVNAEHQADVVRTALDDQRCQVRQPLESRELAEDNPNWPLIPPGRRHEPQEQRVEPATHERPERRLRLGEDRKEEPARAGPGPGGGAPAARALALGRQELEGVGEESEQARPPR